MITMLYADLNEKFIIEYFSELKETVIQNVEAFGEFSPHIIGGNGLYSRM